MKIFLKNLNRTAESREVSFIMMYKMPTSRRRLRYRFSSGEGRCSVVYVPSLASRSVITNKTKMQGQTFANVDSVCCLTFAKLKYTIKGTSSSRLLGWFETLNFRALKLHHIRVLSTGGGRGEAFPQTSQPPPPIKVSLKKSYSYFK